MAPDNEILPVVDIDGNVIGSATRNECHGGTMILHPVVHLHVLDAAGGLLMQKRSETKIIQPGKWDTAVGGHIDYGECVENALQREASEEIGLTDFKAEEMACYVMESSVERELVYSHICTASSDFTPEPEAGECDALRFWKRNEIEAALGTGVFTPNFEMEYQMLRKYLDDRR